MRYIYAIIALICANTAFATIYYNDDGSPDYERINEDMKWIKIEDQLPEKGMPCLLYQTFPSDTVFNCRADPLQRTLVQIGGLRWDGEFISYERQYFSPGLEYITHWMALPKPPKS